MGRKALRQRNRVLKNKLSDEQFKRLLGESNKKYVDGEVNRQIKFYQNLWSECIIEAFAKEGYSEYKAKQLLEDIEVIMLRKAEEKGVKVNAEKKIS